MDKRLIHTLLILAVAGLIGASSYYVTDVRQEQEMERIKENRRLAEYQHARVEDLMVRQAGSEELATGVLGRWNSRYKYIPTTLNTADMVEYLESLTRTGFEQFDLQLTSQSQGEDYSTYTFSVRGTAGHRDLYHLVWHLENNREFYRINDLKINHVNVFKKNRQTGIDRRYDMVAFSFTLDAFYAGVDGVSAPEDSLRPIPLAILHDHSPPRDSFLPLVRTDVPPNDEELLDVDRSSLLSIVGQQAIFEGPGGRHIVFEGDRIYLGEVLTIDPIHSLVRVRVNRGDRVETLTIRVSGTEDGPGMGQTLGRGAQLVPIDPGS